MEIRIRKIAKKKKQKDLKRFYYTELRCPLIQGGKKGKLNYEVETILARLERKFHRQFLDQLNRDI